MPVGVVVVDATGELAFKNTFPALFRLFCTETVREMTVICVAEEDLNDASFRKSLRPRLGAGDLDGFLDKCHFIQGDCLKAEVADVVAKRLEGHSRVLVYLNPLLDIAETDPEPLANKLRVQCKKAGGWLRCVVERPLHYDGRSAKDLTRKLQKAFDGEENIFRLDHFVGKEMVQNIVAVRFANRFLEPSWNSSNVNAVVISCRESILVPSGELASVFDDYGIIRDLIIDHLMHIMALVAMETPVDLTDGKSVSDEVAKVLRCVEPAKLEDTVLGQYRGYTDTEGVNADSTTPTFALCVLYINNPRWHGVPFILKAGKGMYERRTDVRVQFKPPHNKLFPAHRGGGPLNELVIRIQPNSDIYMKMMRKVPGLKLNVAVTKLDLLGNDPSTLLDSINRPAMQHVTSQTNLNKMASRFESPIAQSLAADVDGKPRKNSALAEYPLLNAYTPDSYERLIYDVISNDRSSFSRDDEVDAIWNIFDPLLRDIEGDDDLEGVEVHRYVVGSRGPSAAYNLMASAGFVGYKLESELLGFKPRSVFSDLTSQFSLTGSQMEEIATHFFMEMRRGLQGIESSIRMLPSYVTEIPTSREKGVYYALDLGGTNFRVSRFTFDGMGSASITDERKYTVPDSKMTGTAEELFDFLAECVASLDTSADDASTGGRFYGFTFSFPTQQTAIDRGTLISWTKGFNTTGVVDHDVVELLRDAFKRRGFEGDITALVNDTVGTLISAAYTDPRTHIGVILGTGTNAAYREKVENILKLPKEIRDRGGEMIINTEWGNFGSNGKMLPSTDVDREIDDNSRNKGQQLLEKMISGMYLGEMVRLCLVRMYDSGEIWSEPGVEVKADLRKPNSFLSRYLSDIEYDMSEQLHIVHRVEKTFGVEGSTLEDRIKLKEICGMIIQRAANLTACAIAACIRQIGSQDSDLVVGIDGSVFEHHPSFRQRLSAGLGELAVQCNVILAKDGSGQGAALISHGALIAREKLTSK
ncbi:Glucose-6-phosphate 1-dehydrogenase [Hondaea fermentalgiana]|uniref:hexokinase n=1 Tax=Hondaea fermentalgiana TaxID=2315210 RepID=A0A2R5GF18_9STRA|nr:Glucose-6-phosphate 1-dehydrogenase [Hondaea fermentalgiana]|eukprot:GBG29497.1 Glucose-6-phosphate 1-dehydrogenase [Hondaea fermentalgiana]